MYKSARIFFTLLLAVLLLPACTRKQGPTPSGGIDNGLGGEYDPNFIPGSDLGGFGTELQGRGDDGNPDSGMYKGMMMVEDQLEAVYFDFNSSSVSASERAKLQEAADYLMDNPGDALLIEGHCDWYGTAEYNIALGDRRASSVSDYLATLGVSPNRLETLSKGSLEATPGLPKDQSGLDRRADLIILQQP